MKKTFFAVLGCMLILAACKEHDPTLYLSVARSVDTVYKTSPVPAAQPHQVLIEEFSGQDCANCPAGKGIIDGLVTDHPGQVNVISYYIWGQPQTIPPPGSVHDFRDSVATSLSMAINGNQSIGGLPSAFIDRQNSGGILEYSNQWPGTVATQTGLVDSVNLAISSSYNAADSIDTITAIMTYLNPTQSSHYLTIALVEDSMVDLQEDGNNIDNAYVFTSVFRGMATGGPSSFSDPILLDSTSKYAGETERKIYYYRLPTKSPGIVPAHCRIIAFITYGPSFTFAPVVQSAQCPVE